MKRISNAKFKRMTIVSIITFSLLVLLAAFISFLPDLFPEPKYNELNEKNIVISRLTVSHGRGGNVYQIYTLNGEAYNLTGDFDCDNIRNVFVENTKATIKWSRNRFLLFPDYAEEVIVDGKTFVSYNNDDPISRGPYFIFAGFLTLSGVAFLSCRFWWIKHLKTKQENRDRRIEKKIRSKGIENQVFRPVPFTSQNEVAFKTQMYVFVK